VGVLEVARILFNSAQQDYRTHEFASDNLEPEDMEVPETFNYIAAGLGVEQKNSHPGL
jgi:hypothetical protein